MVDEMITLAQYFGPWIDSPDVTDLRLANAQRLLDACLALETIAIEDGVSFPINPVTRSQISGEKLGGFRPQDCTIGAKTSAHKEGLAIDRYDPDNSIDAWCMAHQDKLAQCGIYIESPTATPHWSHWTVRAPASGNRVFMP